MELTFEKIIPNFTQIRVLYELLSKRRHVISHTEMPSYEEHNDFVLKNPYLAWYLISRDDEFRGSVYVQYDNSIGINFVLPNEEDISGVLSFIKGHHEPLPMIQSVRRGELFVNISANDENLIGILEKVGKKEISRSFIV